MKKRKLNSTNPKYLRTEDLNKTVKQYDRVLVNNVKGVKIYACYLK